MDALSPLTRHHIPGGEAYGVAVRARKYDIMHLQMQMHYCWVFVHIHGAHHKNEMTYPQF